jgi:hypothetical protein
LVWHHQAYSGLGAGIVMESISLIENRVSESMSVIRDVTPTKGGSGSTCLHWTRTGVQRKLESE